MTVRNVSLYSDVSNCYLYACLRLLIKVVQYRITQNVFSVAQLLVQSELLLMGGDLWNPYQ